MKSLCSLLEIGTGCISSEFSQQKIIMLKCYGEKKKKISKIIEMKFHFNNFLVQFVSPCSVSFFHKLFLCDKQFSCGREKSEGDTGPEHQGPLTDFYLKTKTKKKKKNEQKKYKNLCNSGEWPRCHNNRLETNQNVLFTENSP